MNRNRRSFSTMLFLDTKSSNSLLMAFSHNGKALDGVTSPEWDDKLINSSTFGKTIEVWPDRICDFIEVNR
jgi:hypothetical protein